MLLFLICLEILDCLIHKGNNTADKFFFRSSFMPLKVNTTEKTNEYTTPFEFNVTNPIESMHSLIQKKIRKKDST